MHPNHNDNAEKILVDVCCGPCSIPLGEKQDPSKMVFYISNANVHPFAEYVKRLESIRHVSRHYKVQMFIDRYSPKEWMDIVQGHEHVPENSSRCELCYEYRLEKAAVFAKKNGFKSFTTTITTGPSKKAEVVNAIGGKIATKYGLSFLELDLKKNGGFLRSVYISKKLGLYRQSHCGCVFSMNPPRKTIIASPKL